MLKLDDPPGNTIYWDHICRELRISLSVIPSKRWQKEYSEERRYKEAMWRLLKGGFTRFVVDEMFPPPTKKTGIHSGYYTFILTETGRRAAGELKKQEDRKKDLYKTLELLAKQGYKHTTLKQVRGLLWRLSYDKFNNKEEFKKYWNNTKLGLALKKMGIKRMRVGKKDRRKKYMVSPVQP